MKLLFTVKIMKTPRNYGRPNYKMWQITAVFLAAISSTILGVKNLFIFIDLATPNPENVSNSYQ